MITNPGAEFIIERLEQAGFKAFYVGGCLRNALMKEEIKDYDIATSALPEDVCKIFKDCKVFTLGIKHGTVCVLFDSEVYEVTTFRKEGEYSDHRHPNSVSFCTDVDSDLSRRDFTINAMAFNKNQGLIDNFGGFYDSQNRILRAVNNPYCRFEEDALRILRGLRFASVYQLEIESETAKAMLEKANLLRNISAERIFSELSSLVLGDNFAKIVCDYFEIFTVIIPEFNFIKQKELFFKLLSNSNPNLVERLACLFVFCKENFLFIAKRLKFPSELTKKINTVFALLENKLPSNKTEIKKVLTHNNDCFSYYINVENALAVTFSNNHNIILCNHIKELYNEIIKNDECYSLKQLAINGNHLQEVGFLGESIGEALQFLLTAVIEGKVKNSEQHLISYLKKYYE